MEDTICAISTAASSGAIGIVRVSGKDAINIVNNIYKEKDLNNVNDRSINYGHIKYNDEIIDEVLINIMKAPKTYTREDIVEINCHGGSNTLLKIIEILLENGCRLAEPGEFTKRAFLNGRIDLIEAEAVNDLINAKSDNARKLALNNMDGLLSNKIKLIREKLVNVMASIEVNIDYPEYEDIEVMTNEKILPKLKECEIEIKKILDESRNGRLINEGINISIVGKPNVGKSSILNKLIDENKAIVTDVAGTTRDIVEGNISLNGYKINFIDTAGIRETEDIVEKIGVEKSKEVIKNSDVVILVLNNNEEITFEEIQLIKEIPEDKRIIFVNKTDLDNNLNLDLAFISGNTIDVNGIDSLKEEIIHKLNLSSSSDKDLCFMSNVRQIDLLKKALEDIDSAIKHAIIDIPIDIVEIDITNAWNKLGEITGENYSDELINTLFSNFCLGK